MHGHDARFSNDLWTGGCSSLHSHLPKNFPQEGANFFVFPYSSNGTWNSDMIGTYFPSEICGIFIQNGNFTLKSAFKFLYTPFKKVSLYSWEK
ncbi:hypothetical protein MtrunA17_Chr7g0266111 [Medicago truncatula]|uniref:Uncharacterized protein n=1 Tax=Medicago truncatula TaxID=3880 RepID=G7L613_MEDTR|nr:hypothetical protein MTR_7g104310 [Medicago truncatula]RHN48658.1 hypothetical protein MtrunA17_Chr7g0266111 [Medicago truncatula]